MNGRKRRVEVSNVGGLASSSKWAPALFSLTPLAPHHVLNPSWRRGRLRVHGTGMGQPPPLEFSLGCYLKSVMDPTHHCMHIPALKDLGQAFSSWT